MNKFEELDRYLAINYNINTWYDFAYEMAVEIIRQFDENDWEKLESIWREREIAWQVRLANALYSVEDSHTLPLLLELLKSTHLEVAISAVESLEAMDHVFTPDETLRPILESLLNQIQGGDRILVERIISRIKA